MSKITYIIRGVEGFIDGLLTSSKEKAKHKFKGSTTDYTHKIKHPTEPNVYAAVFDVYPDEVNEIWDIIKAEVLNPNHLDKLEPFTDEWKNTEI